MLDPLPFVALSGNGQIGLAGTAEIEVLRMIFGQNEREMAALTSVKAIAASSPNSLQDLLSKIDINARNLDLLVTKYIDSTDCTSDAISKLSQVGVVVVNTTSLTADYSKPNPGRTALNRILNDFIAHGFSLSDALTDKSGRTILAVFSTHRNEDPELGAEFIYGGKLYKLTFGSYDDQMRTKSILMNSFYENHLLNYARSRYRGGSIVDVGANVGNHSVFFASMLSEGAELYSIEPGKKAFGLLEINLRQNNLYQKARPQNVAAGAEVGFVNMTSGGARNLGAVKVVGDVSPDIGPVPVRLLDDIIPSELNIDIVKIDVEGYEINVLRGASRILTHGNPIVYAEAGDKSHKEQLDAILGPYGYVSGAVFNDTPTYVYEKT